MCACVCKIEWQGDWKKYGEEYSEIGQCKGEGRKSTIQRSMARKNKMVSRTNLIKSETYGSNMIKTHKT